MIPVATEQVFVCFQPQAKVNNASLIQNVIDCFGFEFLRVEVFLGDTDIALTAMKLTESDVKASGTSLTGPVDIVGSRFGTDNQDTGAVSVLPSATDDNKVYTFEVDLRGRKRYVLPVITVGNGATGAFVSGVAELSRAAQVPTTAADKGAAQLMKA